MRTSTVLLTSACGLAPAYSFSLSSSLSSSLDTLDTLKTRALSTIDTLLPRKTPACPAIWTTVSADLTKDFLLNGECTDLARAAIRYAFHDAGTFSTKLPTVAPASGGADGSLLLAPEIDRAENGGLQDYHSYIGGKYAQYKGRGVGAADLIQFAGSHAVVTCPGGPTVRTVVGRTDSSAPSPTGVMPPGFGRGSDHDSLLQLFVDKGFSAADLAALIGAHTTSRSFAQQQLPIGTPQDSTPGRWDVKYYDKTKAVGKEFNGFVNNQGKWVGKFADAMFRLSVLGIPPATYNTFADCTGVLPKATSAKRDIRAAPINDRAR